MGIKFSSKKDYNRVLAKQPRTSIMIPSFHPPKNLQKRLDSKSLTIPAPVRLSRSVKNDDDAVDDAPRKVSTVSQAAPPPRPLIQEVEAPPPIPSKNSSPASQKPTKRASEDKEQSSPEIIPQHASLAIQSKRNSPVSKQEMNGGAVIIARSIIQPEKQQRTRDHFPVPSRSSSTIIEHHGKQFLTELKERTERRYVQYFDEETHQMRFFEVTDSIPYRVIRPLNQNIQSRSQSVSFSPPQSSQRAIHASSSTDQLNPQVNPSRNSHDWYNRQPSFPADLNKQHQQRPSFSALPPPSTPNKQFYSKSVQPATSKDRLNTNILPNSINKSNPMITGEHLPNVISSQYNTFNEPIYEQTSYNRQHISSMSPAASTSYSSRSIRKSPLHYNPRSTNGYSRYPANPLSLRIHTPTIASGSTSSATGDSFDSDEQTESSDQGTIDEIFQPNQTPEGYHRMNAFPSSERNGSHHSPAPLDPFARPLNTNGHHTYRPRSSFPIYNEPVKNRIVPRLSQHDYAPIPYTLKQLNYY